MVIEQERCAEGEGTVSVPLCPPHIPHGKALDQTRASEEKVW